VREKFLAKFRKDPVGFFKRALQKGIIDRMMYGKVGGEYDAARYWHDRIAKYGASLRGVGDEGLSEADNARQYREAAHTFLETCHRTQINFQQARVLEIGPGTGFYTGLLHELRVKEYLGIDITDAYFPNLQTQFPRFRFVRKDVTAETIEGQYDIIVMIDVIEHIVTDEKLTRSLATLDGCLTNGGVLILAPILPTGQKHLFYVRFWSLPEVAARLPAYAWEKAVAFRDGELYVARKPNQA
jgi:SAM-dependent methyltransferase